MCAGFLIKSLSAKFYLQEDVNILRWIGTFIIICGVFVLLIGEAKDETKKNEIEKFETPQQTTTMNP